MDAESISKFIARLESIITGAKCGDIESREMLIAYRNVIARDEDISPGSGWDDVYNLVDQCIQDTADNPLA